MRKDVFLPALALVGGGAGFFLRRWQLATAPDPETQLFRMVPATPALLLLGGVLALLFLLLVRGGKQAEDYPAAFRCPSAFYATLMAAGGLLFIGAASLGALEFHGGLILWRQVEGRTLPVMLLLAAVLSLGAGIALLLLGRGNYRGALPGFYPGLTTLPAYAALPWLVAMYQEYSRDPVILRFADMLLGAVCTALAFYLASGFAFQRPRPRWCLFFSLMGLSLNLESLANGQSLFFTVLSIAFSLALLAQSWALLRCCFGPAWPKRLLEERMSGGTSEPEGQTAPETGELEHNDREDFV